MELGNSARRLTMAATLAIAIGGCGIEQSNRIERDDIPTCVELEAVMHTPGATNKDVAAATQGGLGSISCINANGEVEHRGNVG